MRQIYKILVFISLLTFHITAFSLANPASVNCVNQGFQLVLIKNTGICIFSDNSYCEEWAYFRGQCTQGENQFPGGAYKKQMLNQYCIEIQDNKSLVTICNITQ